MYKFVSLCCSLVLIIGITACSKDKPEEQASTPQPVQQQVAPGAGEEQASKPQPAHQQAVSGAGIVIDDSRTLELDATPIDIATSADGKYTFILTEGGKILILGRSGAIKGTITVDEAVENIGTSPKGDFLLLTTSKEKTLQIVKISFVVDIDISGLPFKGPANAPVLIAVFNDYQ